MLDEQILALHEQGASAGEIAESLKCTPQAVDYVLARSSPVDFDNNKCLELSAIVMDVARHGEYEHNRLRAAMFGIEVGRGIKKNRSDLPNISAAQINQVIIAAHNDVLKFVTNGRQPNVAQETGGTNGAPAEKPIEISQQSTTTEIPKD